jgi:hypothetical protein
MRSVEGAYINLDRDTARRAAIEAQLAGLGLPYVVERLPGIDGAKAGGLPAGLRPGQFGCWLSHLAALERSLGSDRHLHVIEDDALISRKLRALPELLGALESGKGDWDLLYLDATLVEIDDMYRMFDWVRQSRERGIVQVCKVPAQFTVFGTHSYVVNGERKRQVHEFLAGRLDSGYPIDNVLAQAIREGALKAFVSAPFLITGSDAGLESSVGYEGGDHGFLAWLLFRRLCFFDLDERALGDLAARAAGLARGVPQAEALFGALCAYRVAAWLPDSRFHPGQPRE